MSGFQDVAKAFVVGVVAIGMATALFAPGRTTVAFAQTAGNTATNLLHTAESG